MMSEVEEDTKGLREEDDGGIPGEGEEAGGRVTVTLGDKGKEEQRRREEGMKAGKNRLCLFSLKTMKRFQGAKVTLTTCRSKHRVR